MVATQTSPKLIYGITDAKPSKYAFDDIVAEPDHATRDDLRVTPANQSSVLPPKEGLFDHPVRTERELSEQRASALLAQVALRGWTPEGAALAMRLEEKQPIPVAAPVDQPGFTMHVDTV